MSHHPLSALASLKRPRLLLKAAMNGINKYSRERHMATLLATRRNWSDAQLLEAIIADEEYLEDQRRSGDANYSVSRHVKLMIALVSEARRSSRPCLVE